MVNRYAGLCRNGTEDRIKSLPITKSIQSLDALEFECNYTSADYATVKALEGKDEQYAVWFGGTEDDGVVTPTGSDGKFKFNGELTAWVTGGGVNEVVGMTVSIAASTVITQDT